MKFFLALFLFAGVAFSNSTHYYGWQPHKELVFRFQSQVLSGIPEINDEQYGGLRLTSTVRVQSFQDYSLKIKLDNTRFFTVNGEVREFHQDNIPEELRSHLEKPFEVHLKRGVVENFFVAQDEPIVVTNIKKALLSQLQLDVSASRRSEVESNAVEHGSEESSREKYQQERQYVDESRMNPVDQTYFTVREESLHGDCQTSYTIHELPQYESYELEQQWEQDEKRRNSQEHLQGGLSQGKQLCQGKKYWQITKTKNFDNCLHRPVYQKWTGIQSKCDSTRSSCKDLFTHISATNYIVCGHEINDFVIRKTVTENTIMATPLAWTTEERMRNKATVTLELLKEESSFTPFQIPSNKKTKQTLIFEYPEKSQWDSRSQIESQRPQQSHEDRDMSIQPVLPKPSLTDAPKMLIPVNLPKEDIARQVSQEMKKIAEQVFESPESCSSAGDVAGYLAIISKALRPLSLQDLKYVEQQVFNQNSRHQNALRSLFNDLLSMVGTNPSFMLIKSKIESQQLKGKNARFVLQSSLRAINTPTKELLQEIVSLVKHLESQQDKELFNVAMVQTSQLLYKACINPASKMTEYPVKIYGVFCNKDMNVITEDFIPFLQQQVRNTENRKVQLVAITALGKLGHIKSFQILAKTIQTEETPLVRSLAVYSLKRVAKMQPVQVKPLILTLIGNSAEHPEVRIAAISILPWCQPSTAELQKIALRSWFEPSKQVASFTYSTFKSLRMTEVPELKPVGQRVASLLRMVKPYQFGGQFSHNSHWNKFVEYLKVSISQGVSWTTPKEALLPSRISSSTKLFGGAFEASGLNWELYTQSMDKTIDQVIYWTSKNQASQQVKEALNEIVQKLDIQTRQPKLPVEMFMQMNMMGFEKTLYTDKQYFVQLLEEVSEKIGQMNDQDVIPFEYTRALQAIDIQTIGPCDAGFPIYIERSMPVVYAIKGKYQYRKSSNYGYNVPSMVKIDMVPVINIKMEANMGVISPFTHQLIGSGVDQAVHVSLPLEAEMERQTGQVSLTFKTPEQVQRQVELVHVYVKPFTVKKDLKHIQPVGKSSSLKPIRSGQPMKTYEAQIGKYVDIDAQIVYKSDNKYNDLYSYWNKIRQQNFVSLLNTFPMVSSVRESSTKIVYNPQQSRTKEFQLTFSLVKASKSQEEQQVQFHIPAAESLTDRNIIKEICQKTFKNSDFELEKCIMQLSTLEVVSEEAEEFCRDHRWAEESAKQACLKTASICTEAKKVCEHSSPRSSRCLSTKNQCFSRLVNIKLVHKTLREQESGEVTALSVAFTTKSSDHESKKYFTAISVGSSKKDNKVKLISDIEVKAFQNKPVYEVRLESEATLPEIEARWCKQTLLDQALRLVFGGKVEFGFRQQEKSQVSLSGLMEKSQKQKESVRASPEYRQCEAEEQKGHKLAPVCMKTRHQAASLDKISTHIRLPQSVLRSAWFNTVQEYLQSYFMGQFEEYTDGSYEQEGLKLRANFSRNGDEAQLEVENNGRKFVVYNIRLPKYLSKDLVPISMRNPLKYNIMQKITMKQTPSSCRIEPNYIGTFDNKTYSYQINDCWHLLFKDCSNQLVPVAVMAKTVPSGHKNVRVISGQVIVLVEERQIQLNIHGDHKVITLDKGMTRYYKVNNKVVLWLKRYHDEVLTIHLPQENLLVITDGKRIEISAPLLLRQRSCGLCGDLNGENTADIKTPEKCLMDRPRFAAYSYMMTGQQSGQQCSGIPSNDQTEYRKQKQECVKERVIKTDLSPYYQQEQMAKQRPLTSQHLVEKQKRSGQVCISKQKVQSCSRQELPQEAQRKRVQYVCMTYPSLKAQQLEQRAKAGENLDTELNPMPVAFSKMEYEPIVCKNTNSIQH